MVEKCANPQCSKPFDCGQGRLYCCPMQLGDGSPRANSHGVEHHWLCGSCAKIYTFEPRPGFGAVITRRSTASTEGQLRPEIRVSGTA
jgi:hypothetical protein